jgi:predicted ATPase/DNA-binding XRE family transcriptional regulator
VRIETSTTPPSASGIGQERAAVSDSPTSFGVLLRQLRSAASLSQEELAERAGLSVRGISDLERGLRHTPRLETVRLLADALALREDERAALLAAARPAVFTWEGATDVRRHPAVSLPAPLTRLIGRETELAALRIKLHDDAVRLLTLTGSGGTGKTRLAIAVAVGMADAYPDGVVFVDLSPLTDPNLVMPTIAAEFGVRESTNHPLRETLSRFLASKQVLLVLDNCERVLAATPELTALLAASPGLTVLATSREPLHVRGEQVYPLSPLPVAASDQVPIVEELAHVPAIALFVERASAMQPAFALTEDNAAAVAAVCRRLDGLPLAIELAAARVTVLQPAALLARLEQRLPLLTGGGHDLPARQRTMRDAIAWSYDLLPPDAQALFRRLAVFAGGFTLTTAEAVAGTDGAHPVLDGVVTLVEQSLLRQVSSSDVEPRYLMLETVREFGLERLVVAGEDDDARQRHADYFLRRSDRLARGPQMLQSLVNLTGVAAEHDNVRLALDWFDDRGDIDALLRLSPMLYGLWFQRGLYREARQWVEQALARSTHTASVARGEALVAAGFMAAFQGDHTRADMFVDQGLALARELDDPVLIGDALAYTALICYRRGEFARADALLDEALTLLRDRAHITSGALTLQLPGDVAQAQERFDLAANRYREAIDHFQAPGYSWGLSDAQAGLAGVSYCVGDYGQATALYTESLDRAYDLNFTHLVASALLGLAAVTAAFGRPEEGAHFLGAAEGMMDALGAPMFPRDLPVLARGLVAMRLVLEEEHLATAREVGRSMSGDQVVAKARSMAAAVTASVTAERH